MFKNQTLINMLDGAVQSQGVKLGVSEWLDPGSKEYGKTPLEARAAAYQAAKVTGFTDEGLRNIMVGEFAPRITQESAQHHIDLLKALAERHPVVVEEVRPVVTDRPVYKTKPGE